MSGHITIYNDLYHIRVTNINTKVVSYFLKHNLVIQKDNDSSFFLKNDSYIKYFKYSDILSPSSNDITHLIQTIVDYMMVNEIANTIISVNEMEKADIVFDVSVHSGKNEHLICEKTDNDASSQFNNNAVIMELGNITTGTNSITRQSKEYANIPSGRINISLVSGTLAKNITADNVGTEENDGVVSKIGIFDDDNGVYVQYEATINASFELEETYSICKKMSGQPVEKVVQANWNVDKCNGLGPSQIVISKEDMNTFIFRLGTLPKTFLQIGIMHEGSAILIHEFNTSDFFTKLPIRWFLSHNNNAGITSAIQMIQNNSVVLSNEKHYIQKVSHSAICPPNSYKKIDSDFTQDVVFDIKLNPTYIRSKIKIEKINIINTQSNGIVLWKLLKNADLLDNALNTTSSSTYTTNSIVDLLSLDTTQSHDGSSFELTNYKIIDPSNQGTLISSGYIVNNTLTEIDLSKNDNNVLYADIDGVSDNLTLVVEYVNAPAEIQATIVWCEYE